MGWPPDPMPHAFYELVAGIVDTKIAVQMSGNQYQWPENEILRTAWEPNRLDGREAYSVNLLHIA